jgi:selenocysteine lyase/cysteine desulfurase
VTTGANTSWQFTRCPDRVPVRTAGWSSEPLTPTESTAALISFVVKDSNTVEQRLRKANVNARVSQRYIRIAPSVFNDMNDIEKLLEALA